MVFIYGYVNESVEDLILLVHESVAEITFHVEEESVSMLVIL